MNYYIQIVNGKPFNHPIIESNLLEAFPGIDLNNLPANIAKFERIHPEKANLGSYDYKKRTHSNYVLSSDGVTWQDQWVLVDQHPEILNNGKNHHALMIAKHTLTNLKNKAQEIIATLTDADELQVWNTYKSMIDKITSHEPHDQLIPKYPIKDSSGKYVPNIDSSGNWVMRVLHDPNKINPPTPTEPPVENSISPYSNTSNTIYRT
jgi:hypothetical protein